jgi:hypothetical protein
MTIRSLDESERKRIEDVIRKAYLEDKQSLAWTVGTIASSPVRGESLRAILDQVRQASHLDEGKKQKISQLSTELKNKNLL